MTGNDSYSNFKGCVSNEDVCKRTDGVGAHCGVEYELSTHQAHMILPKRLGGKQVLDNCVILCDRCFERYNDKFFVKLGVEFPNMTYNSIIRSLGYIEKELDSITIESDEEPSKELIEGNTGVKGTVD